MSTIDLIVLGMLKQESRGAYDIQKLVEYRNISKWVKISTPSIYKKTLQLEKKGLIKATTSREGKMPPKTVYSLTEAGEKEFENLMFSIASNPIRIFLDFNAVIVNLDSLSPTNQKHCIEAISTNVAALKAYLEENLKEKSKLHEIPETGIAVLQQQLILIEAIEKWLATLSIKKFGNEM
ncbi:transcriptional regulator [Streptococcus criceti]|uniref:Transcription regulator PadR N-terminal domain-containing protein n=1 Tax=Streptococcus criceti HS-6 TaxID=873449 RepID=G5JR19_STRCG|nr:PadR family transcriptional regulator [Streptococcus criceti]EHI73768.1 hypothetical protein STRCR_1903 [Streptococcus criceti HS-6]SUN43003.1 transcriptional regulator [Streptococcus criceti]